MKWRFLALGCVLLALGCSRTRPLTPTPVLEPISTPIPIPPATPTPEALVYLVEPGDTLWDIALEYGVTVEALIVANGLQDPDSLAVGQRLFIPFPGG